MNATCEEKTTSVDSAVPVSGSWRRGLYLAWRVVISGFSFAVFMVLALVFTLAVFPLARVVSRTSETKGRRVRWLIQFMFGQFIKFWTAIGIMRPPNITGFDSPDISGPCIIVANHPTLIDVVVMGSLIRDFNCVVKHALHNHFFLGGSIRAAGYVTNNGPLQVIRHCCEGFERGQSLIIFPEGSRSVENGLRPFSRGAAQLALRSGVPLIPVVIRCDPPSLMKHQRWYDVPDRPFQLSLTFHPPLDYQSGATDCEPLARKARRFTGQIEDFFRKEMEPKPIRNSSDSS